LRYVRVRECRRCSLVFRALSPYARVSSVCVRALCFSRSPPALLRYTYTADARECACGEQINTALSISQRIVPWPCFAEVVAGQQISTHVTSTWRHARTASQRSSSDCASRRWSVGDLFPAADALGLCTPLDSVSHDIRVHPLPTPSGALHLFAASWRRAATSDVHSVPSFAADCWLCAVWPIPFVSHDSHSRCSQRLSNGPQPIGWRRV
jgi:hypothetical protein